MEISDAMAGTQLIELEATEIETTTLREAAPGPSRRRRTLVFLGLLIGLLIIWEFVKVTFQIADYNLPHVYDIPLAFLKPIVSTGQPMGLYIFLQTRFTVYEAVVGFLIGGLAGFVLGVLFAHSRLLERGCLPYLIASQTVPILAVAPMVVIWLGRGFMSIALIASYLTFFPVAINTLRGLNSVDPAALELMQSYAASRRAILFKLRVPASLPYLFTALKISSTASIIGALIAEMTGTQQGLGWNLVYFAQYYNSNPPNLWAAIIVSSILGLIFYSIIVAIEHRVVKWHPKME
jgi:NitT/TauT family transport system permease protein